MKTPEAIASEVSLETSKEMNTAGNHPWRFLFHKKDQAANV